ncbi:helix-turn-helix transcriptional regulator [Streptomyces capparidis]
MRLRALREATGLTMEEAGERAGVSKATISRYESSEGPVRWIVVDQLCRVYGTDDEQRLELKELARTSKARGWWLSAADDFHPSLTTYLALENEASRLEYFANAHIPGLLQTREYALAAGLAEPVPPPGDVIERRVEARMRRQEVLRRPDPVALWAVLDESVLHRPVGGPEVMRRQLAHLVDLSERPHVTIQVLPLAAGAHSTALTSFILIGGPDPSLDVVFTENLVGALFLEKPPEIVRYREAFDHLRTLALDAAQSAELIRALAEEGGAAGTHTGVPRWGGGAGAARGRGAGGAGGGRPAGERGTA